MRFTFDTTYLIKFKIPLKSFIGSLLILYNISILSHDYENVPSICRGKLTLDTIIRCTLDHSPEYKAAKYELEMRIGQKKAAEYLFPSNPIVSTMASQRTIQEGRFPPIGSQTVTNAEILVSQEIYTGGKRQLQLQVADQFVRSAIKKVQALENQTIIDAIHATVYYQSTQEEYQLAIEILQLAEKTNQYATRKYQLGLAPAIDAELSLAELQKARSYLEDTLRRKKAAVTDLYVMMGLPYIENDQNLPEDWKIPQIPEIALEDYLKLAKENRADYEALSWEAKAMEARKKLVQKERIPNVTLSGFIQNDGFNERVVGARITIPLPIARDYSAELLSAQAESKQALAREEIGEHTVRSQAIKAWNNYFSWKKVYEEYKNSELSKNYQETLDAIQRATERGDLSIRDAILLKKPFLDYKVQLIQIKREFALSSIEFLRAAGLSYVEKIRSVQNENYN